MLRKNAFQWTEQSSSAFEQLKAIMTTALILALFNFFEGFIIECDASNIGVGVVLLQNNKPTAYFSRSLAIRHKCLPCL